MHKVTHNEQWFIDRIGLIIFRDKSTCNCKSCRNIVENGIEVKNESHAHCLYTHQNDYGSEGVFLNYRDIK